MSRWSRLRKGVTAFSIAACFASAATAAHAQQTLNVLTWCDNVDAGLLKPFEAANGVKINNKTYDGTGTALAVLKQSNPGDWDVLVVDSTDVKRVVSYGILAPLDPAGFPWDDIPKTLRNPAFHYVDGKLYAVPEKFGYNSIAYNKNKVDAKEMMDATAIWDPKYKGKVAIYDYYNAVIPQVAIGLGYDPDNVTEAEFPAIKAKLLLMKQNARLVGDITTVQTALATGDVDMVISGGEYVVAGLAHDKPNLDWVLPSKGGLRWEQAIGILADSKKKALANKFLHYILTPDAQGKLATSSCYWGMPVNMKATLTADQKKILRWDQQPGFIAHSFPFPQPSTQLDKDEQDLWAETISEIAVTALAIAPSAAEKRAERRDAVKGLAFSAPAALYTLAFFIVPLIIIAFYSLYETAFRGLGPGPGLSNYRSFFTHDAWVDALFNSLALTLVTTAASVVLAYPIAYLLAFRVPRRWQRLALTLMVLPFWTSYIVRSYAWLLVLSPDGVINQALMLLGVTHGPLRLAYNNAATVVGFVHFFIMLLTLTIYANLSQLSPRYLLAASDLGAGWLQSFWYVLLPLSVPGIVSGAFMTFVLCIGDYITPQILGGDRTLVMPQEMFFQISRNADFSMASAMAVILMAVMALAYLASSRWLRMDRL